ncbi:putative response regulator [Paenibacillus agaridevorans]|uniref:Putative response regulator n=1 Tax=Paenibacillus agaridevorans TaxID=171404 RepID=A0A2R5EQL7_9BACL|nr:response regulator [Paenibacillus agaridevorans]GBG05694.1 putative response regulator [Paenibacillus agaridevorans]
MIKIMIVDDELFVRIGLKAALNWEKHGFILVGEASNGRQALELVSRTTPDIVITDIKMPELDGIELIKELAVSHPRVACLVLSNFDDFALVREAMKHGAADYLLKVTIETETLLEALRQVASKLGKLPQEQNREIDRAWPHLERTADFEMLTPAEPREPRAYTFGLPIANSSTATAESSAMRASQPESSRLALSAEGASSGKKLLADLTARRQEPAYLATRISELGFDSEQPTGFWVILLIHDYARVLESRFDGDGDHLNAVVTQLTDGLIRFRQSGKSLCWSSGCWLLGVTMANNAEAAVDANVGDTAGTFVVADDAAAGSPAAIDSDAAAIFLAERVQTALKDYLDLDSRLAYGLCFRGYNQLMETLNQVDAARLTTFYEEPATVVRIGEAPFDSEHMEQAYNQLNSRLTSGLYHRNRTAMDAAWLEFVAFARSRRSDPALLNNYFVSVVGSLQEALRRMSDKAMLTWRFDLAQLHNCTSAVDLELLGGKLVDECERTLGLLGDDRQRDEILRIAEYIRCNMQVKITLEEMARYVAMNKNYLSRLFKKETGQTFQDYVTAVRMEKAGDYLLTTDHKIAEIAASVGYSDIFYFNRVFKSHFDMPPTVYRKFAAARGSE